MNRTMRRTTSLSLRVCVTAALLAVASAVLSARGAATQDWTTPSARAVGGADQARLLPPAGATVAAYENEGYRLHHRDGEVWIDVDTSPVQSSARWNRPASWDEVGEADDQILRLARKLVAGRSARSEFEVASAIYGWVAANISYELDRDASQSALDVLERRSAYCTGIARLTVALLDAAGLEAREVAGYVLGHGADSEPQGFHRWVETRLSDVGWLFSDPLFTHHYVPATYLRLDSEMVIPEAGLDGLLIERRDDVVTIDVYPAAPSGILARRNDDRQMAAALRVEVSGAVSGLAVLEGNALRFTHALVDGGTTFLGLEPGSYRLEITIAGRPPVRRAVELVDRRRSILRLDGSTEARMGTPPERSIESRSIFAPPTTRTTEPQHR